MKVYLMDLLPYGQHFDEFKAGRFIPYPLPGRHFDPRPVEVFLKIEPDLRV